MKTTVFLLCDTCSNILLSTNEVVGDKVLVCGHGCGDELRLISKQEALAYFQEKAKDERKV